MNARLNIFIIVVFLLFVTSLCQAQETKTEGYPGSYVRLRRRHYPVYKDTYRLYFQTSQIQEQKNS